MKRFLKYTSCLSTYCYNFTYVDAYIHNCMHSYCHITLQYSFVRGRLLSKLFGSTPSESHPWMTGLVHVGWHLETHALESALRILHTNFQLVCSACCAQHSCASLCSSWQLITVLVAYISCCCWRSLSAGFAPALKQASSYIPTWHKQHHPSWGTWSIRCPGPSFALWGK